MKAKKYNLCVKKEYTSKGETKKSWPRVGTLTVIDDGKIYVDLPLLPKIYCFEWEERNNAQQVAESASKPLGPPSGDNMPDANFPDDDLPF